MCTKMAPSHASLFMDKLEIDFLGSCDKTPLIWLRFLDDIFMIWNHSEKDLHDFISKINNCHDTIKFTFKYSNQVATFLDVNIKMKEYGELDTSVHEKVTIVEEPKSRIVQKHTFFAPERYTAGTLYTDSLNSA